VQPPQGFGIDTAIVFNRKKNKPEWRDAREGKRTRIRELERATKVVRAKNGKRKSAVIPPRQKSPKQVFEGK